MSLIARNMEYLFVDSWRRSQEYTQLSSTRCMSLISFINKMQYTVHLEKYKLLGGVHFFLYC